MIKKAENILRQNQLSVTDTRIKMLRIFLSRNEALTHGDIEHNKGDHRPLFNLLVHGGSFARWKVKCAERCSRYVNYGLAGAGAAAGGASGGGVFSGGTTAGGAAGVNP